MSIAAAIIGSSVTSGGGSSQVAADIYFNSDNMPNTWTGFGTTLSGQSSTAGISAGYTYPDSSVGNVYTFTGNEELWSPNLGNANSWTTYTNALTIDFWFYPTATGIQLLTEANSQSSPGYHYTVLELNDDRTISAKFWAGTLAGSSYEYQVTLNQWNHVYFYEDTQGGHVLQVNGNQTNGLPTYTRSGPGAGTEFFGIGYYDSTNMGNTGRFQGKIGALNIHDSVVPSTFLSTKSKYGL